MSEQEKKRQRIYDMLNAETKPNFLCLPYTKQKFFFFFFFTEKELFKEKRAWKTGQKTKKQKESFLTVFTVAIKNDSTTLIRKHANELKVCKKQDLSPDLDPLNYVIWGVLENKTNANFYPNIGSLKIVIEEEWNKMSEEFILKACKSFRTLVYTIIEKNGGYIE